ncbi:MAG: universal stress protein, partial [Brevibacterium sp.]
VVGSSESALHGVFLGSTATHIMRHSPVPMIMLPQPRR